MTEKTRFRMHAIGGLPRSGSTLLCNILAQNPDFQVGDTDILPGLLRGMIDTWSKSPEIKHKLMRDNAECETVLNNVLCAATHDWVGWYPFTRSTNFFSKSRGWQCANFDIFEEVGGFEPVLIIVVRNPLNVFASMEKHHRKIGGILDDEGGMTLEARAEQLFAYSNEKKGLIGRAMAGIMDLVDRQIPFHLVKGEFLSQEPEAIVKLIYKAIGVEYPEESHQFDSVVNVSDEPDYFYLNRFPHKGEGQVLPMDEDAWKGQFTPEFAERILKNPLVAMFCKHFGYNQPKKPMEIVNSPRLDPKKRPKWSKKRK